MKKREAETEIDYQNVIFISSNRYYQLANMTSKRKVKSTSHIQQTPKTKQLSTKNSTPTPNSSIHSSAATNKQNCISAKPLWRSTKKASIIYEKKLNFWREESPNLKARSTLLKQFTVFSKQKSTTKSNIRGDRALLSTD